MQVRRIVFKALPVMALTFSATVGATGAGKLHVCAEKQARTIGYYVAGVDTYDENYFDIRLEQEPGSEVSVRDIVAADEARGGGIYDRLVSMRSSIKSCAGFYGRLDISDFDGAAIVKDR